MTVHNSSKDHENTDLGWLEDDSDEEEVDSTPAEEFESKLIISLEKDFFLKN